MQTKNINLERAPNNVEDDIHRTELYEVIHNIYNHNQNNGHNSSHICSCNHSSRHKNNQS